MSVICAVKKDGVVSIAADTMARFGNAKETSRYINGGGKMIRHAGSVIAFVGHACWDLVLSKFLTERPASLSSRQQIFETMLDLHAFAKEQCFLNAHDSEMSFETTRIHMLIANDSGLFGAYELRSVQEYTRFYAFGSGEAYAMGAMHALYGSNLNAGAIARQAVLAACEFDDGCGEPVEEATVVLQ